MPAAPSVKCRFGAGTRHVSRTVARGQAITAARQHRTPGAGSKRAVRGPLARVTAPRGRPGRATALLAVAFGAILLMAACSNSIPAVNSAGTASPATPAAPPSPAASSPAAPAAPSPPPLPAYCGRGGAELWAHLADCGWPGPTNTGPDLAQCPEGQLVANSGSLTRTIEITTPNTVISCEDVQGMLDIQAQNVTVRNSVVESNSGQTGEDANGTAAIK